MDEKLEILRKYLKDLGTAAVAFSGGADSAFLLKTAHDVLGDNAVAVTVKSCLCPESEIIGAREFCEKYGIRLIIVDTDPLNIEGFAENPPNRCYICKRDLLGKIKDAAARAGITNIAEGSNADDDGDYRPGMLAVRERGVLSPLKEAGLTKAEIRALSKMEGLPTWNKPSAACLASRIPYGEKITAGTLNTIDRAERYLHDKGFGQLRVRVHGTLARIELQKTEFNKILAISDDVTAYFKELGFKYISLDLRGFRTGSMNEALDTDAARLITQK